MSEKFISSSHIEKLGHKIQEIRVRALRNIISKLESGFMFDNDLARSKELLQKLLEWFSFPDRSCEIIVFKLMKDLLQTQSGQTLIKYYGNDKLVSEIKEIEKQMDSNYFSLISDIINVIHERKEDIPVVPPLESDIPLSYRSGDYCSASPLIKLHSAEATATPIEGLVQQSSSKDQETGIESVAQRILSLELETMSSENINLYIPYYTLCWYPLVNTDQHVLESVQNSLRSPITLSALLHSCYFFSDVMLHDFPAEVFLQRPAILLESTILLTDCGKKFNLTILKPQELQKLLVTCTSSRIKTAVFNGLIKFTKLLKIQVNYYSDPCTHNLKQFLICFPHSRLSSPVDSMMQSGRTSVRSYTSSDFENPDIVNQLKTKQIPMPMYCLNTMSIILDYLLIKPNNHRDNTYWRKNRMGINKALLLLNKLIDLFGYTVSNKIWEYTEDLYVKDLSQILRELLIKFGDTIDYIRIDTISNDFEANIRFIHINILNSCLQLLSLVTPVDKVDVILPMNLKNVLVNTLLDSTIFRLYPGMHEYLLNIVEKFSGRYENDTIVKYKDLKNICKSMTASIKLYRNYKTLSFKESLVLMRSSLDSLSVHRKLCLIKIFVELCANKLSRNTLDERIKEHAEEITLKLLCHYDMDIRSEMYRLCHKRVIDAIGPTLNTSRIGMPGSQILFLLHFSIINEITIYGLSSNDSKIQKCAEDILLHILKCKILVSDEIWDNVIEALILAFPSILCYVEKDSFVGRTAMSFLDPDKALSMKLTTLEVLRGNSCLLFNADTTIREEAISRLCWLLASQGDNADLLPRVNTLFDKSLSMCCQIKHAYDINKSQDVHHYYQPSSLEQVLKLLKSNNVEPVIRRSALTQVSVMVDDPMMHNTFIQNDGLESVISVMKSALNESDYNDYPDSVIPAMSILKSICLHNAITRQELSTNVEIYYLILRGLFLFCTEERMKHEGSTLLFLLLYGHLLRGHPSKRDVSLPEIIKKKLKLPFTCYTYTRNNEGTTNKVSEILFQDKFCLQSLQIHWNSEWFGSFTELLNQITINYKESDNFNSVLQLSRTDLLNIQNSSLEFCINTCLSDVTKAASHQEKIDLVIKLYGYINLYDSMKYNFIFESDVLSLPWKDVFIRFLKAGASGDSENDLLQHILQFLASIVPLYKEKGGCWISDFLKKDANSLLYLLSNDYNQNAEVKSLNTELLILITKCVCLEQHYLDLYGINVNNESFWYNIIEIIASNLKFNDSQHFYNLAYLDSLLSCLVHLTASFGWSHNGSPFDLKKLFTQLVSGLCEMIAAFYCGKGDSAANSVMGLSITRHAILILNHILVEMKQSNIQDWESLFVEEELGIEDTLLNLTSLWSSRDVILRAGAFQLFAGLAVSHRCAINIVQDYRNKIKADIWEVVLNVILDHEEANVVKENSLYLLTNLASHTITTVQGGFKLDSAITPSIQGTGTTNDLLKLLNDHNFYKELELITSCLYLKNKFYFEEMSVKKMLKDYDSPRVEYTKQLSSESSNDSAVFVITTPGVVKALAMLLHNLIGLSFTEVATNLHNYGLIQIILKSLFIPDFDIIHMKDYAFYCDILEMNTAICALLNGVVNSPLCLNTILNTRDYLNLFFIMLNNNIYNCEFSQLIYLRNKLWTQIFNLLGALLNVDNNKNENSKQKKGEVIEIFSSILAENSNEAFLQTLCESMATYNSLDLQNSALTSLTSLLNAEMLINKSVTNMKSKSIQNLLDTNCTPRTPLYGQDNKSNIESHSSFISTAKSSRQTSPSTRPPFHQFYIESLKRTPKHTSFVKISERASAETNFIIAGAELCRILLYLLEVANIKRGMPNNNKKKSLILNSLTSLLCVSQEAKKYALQNGLLDYTTKQIKEYHLKLSLESVDSLRRVADRKRITPIIQEINALIGLLTNFMASDVNVKGGAVTLGLADLIHKLWIWIILHKNLLKDVLKMLCTLTNDCQEACQSLPLTSAVAGSGPRKSPSNVSLLHAIICLIAKEMEQISKTHDLSILEFSFQSLCNCCSSSECRIILSKSNLLQSSIRLHPAITKRQKPWEVVELIWLEFLQAFSAHSEGQFSIAKVQEILDVIITLANSNKVINKEAAMGVLRNISFYPSNRARLLASADFLNILNSKLVSGNLNEKMTVVTIIWALAANNQKAKLMLKCAGLETKLQEALKLLHLSIEYDVDKTELDRMQYVLNMLKESDK